jgi:hypothetical protein
LQVLGGAHGGNEGALITIWNSCAVRPFGLLNSQDGQR